MLQVLLLRLRQACVHPFLCQSRAVTAAPADDDSDEEADTKGKKRAKGGEAKGSDGGFCTC